MACLVFEGFADGLTGAVGCRLAVSDGRVVASPEGDTCTIPLDGGIVFPGLVNGHDHLHLNAAPELRPHRRFGDFADWVTWLQGELSRKAKPQGLAAPIELRYWQGGLKNALAGATTVAHHDPWHEVLDHPAFPVRVARTRWAHSVAHAGEHGPRLRDSLGLEPRRSPWVIHLGECLSESKAASELDAVKDAGALDADLVVVHGVGLGAVEQQRLVRAGGAVLWCPSSNINMLGTTLNARIWLGSGRLGLGTDSRLTGADDLLQELRSAKDAGGLGAPELVELATSATASVLGLVHAGRLRPGDPADLIVMPLSQDPVADLVGASRADLRAVVVGGRPVVADPDFEPLFDVTSTPAAEVRLDGRPKLMAVASLGPPGVADLEPGLEVVSRRPS